MLPPLYYIPPGIEIPAHIAPGLGRMHMAQGAGPAGVAPAGIVIGGDFVDGIDWIITGEGWCISPEAPPLAVLTRSDRPIGLMVEISGGEVMVPQLLEPDLSYAAHLIHRHLSERAGSLQLQRYVEHQALADRLDAYLRPIILGREPDLDDLGVWQLACDILDLALHAGPMEHAHWHPLRESDPIAVITAAAGWRDNDEQQLGEDDDVL